MVLGNIQNKCISCARLHFEREKERCRPVSLFFIVGKKETRHFACCKGVGVGRGWRCVNTPFTPTELRKGANVHVLSAYICITFE